MRMRPEDFGVPMIDQAHRLLRASVAHSGGSQLDRNSATWLIPIEHRERLLREIYALGGRAISRSTRTELLGIEVRWTVEDNPSTPELQLVMEPVMSPRP